MLSLIAIITQITLIIFFFFFDALFDFVKNRATYLHRFFTRCASYIRTSFAIARSPTVNPEGVIDHRRGCQPPVVIFPPHTQTPKGWQREHLQIYFVHRDDTQRANHSVLTKYIEELPTDARKSDRL